MVPVVPSYRATGSGAHERVGKVEELFQRGQTRAFHPGPTRPARLTRRRRCVEAGIQAQSGNQSNRFPEGLAEVEQVQDGVAAVPHRHQRPMRQPAAELQNHPAGPVGELLAGTAPPPVIAFRRRRHGEEGQSPAPSGPGYVARPHQRYPAQAAGFDHIAAAGAYRITVNPKGTDLRPPTPFQGLVDAEYQRTIAPVQMADQQYQQDPGHLKGRPCRPVENVMVTSVIAVAAQPHAAKGRGHGAPAWGQYGTNQQDLSFPPSRAAKQCCEGDKNR